MAEAATHLVSRTQVKQGLLLNHSCIPPDIGSVFTIAKVGATGQLFQRDTNWVLFIIEWTPGERVVFVAALASVNSLWANGHHDSRS